MGGHEDASGGDGKPLTSPVRRVVKATPPPPSSTATSLPSPEDVEEKVEVNLNKVTPFRDPSVEHEVEEELKEKWRQQRLEASSQLQRRHRDIEIEEKRKGQQQQRSSSSTCTPDATKFAYSVEPQFPDHKRTVETASLPRTRPLDEPLDKKVKVTEEEDDEKKDRGFVGEEEERGSWSWNQVVPAVALCVAVLFVAERLVLRRRK